MILTSLKNVLMPVCFLMAAVSCRGTHDESAAKDIVSDLRGDPARTIMQIVTPDDNTASSLTAYGSKQNCFQVIGQPGVQEPMEYYLEGFSVPGCDSDTNASILSAQTLARRFAHIKIKQEDYWGVCFWGAWVPNSIQLEW